MVDTGIVGHVPCGRQEYAARVHQFTEREVDQQRTHEEEVDKKYHADSCGNDGAEGYKTHGQLLDGKNVHVRKVAHVDAGKGNADDEKQREVIGYQRNVTKFGVLESAAEQEAEADKNQEVRHVQSGNTDLQDTVNKFHETDASRHGFEEESHVPDHDEQE